MPDDVLTPTRTRAALLVRATALAALLAAGGCGGTEGARAAEADAAAPTPPPTVRAAPAPPAAPRDSNQAFLRRLRDHHEGLVALADSAQASLQGADAVQDADRIARAERTERQRIRETLARAYADSARAAIPDADRPRLLAVTSARGPAADTVFYRQVAAHHRAGVRAIEAALPHLDGETRRTAERALADARREMHATERRAGGA